MSDIEVQKQDSNSVANYIILGITVIFGVIYISQIRDYQGTIQFMMTSPIKSWLISSIPIDILGFVLIPFAIHHFWKRRKIGWIILNTFSVFYAIKYAQNIYYSLTWAPTTDASQMSAFIDQFIAPSPNLMLISILMMLLFISIIMLSFYKQVKFAFGINHIQIRQVIIWSCLGASLYLIDFFRDLIQS